jgi:hypothetical protein
VFNKKLELDTNKHDPDMLEAYEVLPNGNKILWFVVHADLIEPHMHEYILENGSITIEVTG